MSSLQSAAPIPAGAQKGYDPEIKDMADYIHNYKVDSDLAVCAQSLRGYFLAIVLISVVV